MRQQPEPNCELAVKVSPRSSRNKIVVEGKSVRVWVTAAPTDGQANDAVCALISKAAGLAPSRVSVVRGHTSRDKVLCVEGLDSEALSARLSKAID